MERLLERRLQAVLVAATVLCAACGSGSGGGGQVAPPPPANDNVAPSAVIRFPPDGSLTDAESITLTLDVSDQTGIDFVRANGFPAALDADGLWRVSVPLSTGIDQILVETRDISGNDDRFAAGLMIRRSSALWIEPESLLFQFGTGNAFVLDPALRAIVRVLPTGARSVLSGPGAGGGIELAKPRDMDLVLDRDEIVVTDGELDAVILVELASGERRILSSPTAGQGPTPLDLHGVAVDLARDRALVLDAGRAELLAVDLVTGRRTTVSSSSLGSGPSLAGGRRVALDSPRRRVLVSVESPPAILAIDLASGDRSVLSGGTPGSGPAFVAPFDIAVDLLSDRALVTDPGAEALFELDLASGARRILASRSIGQGPWGEPSATALGLGGVPLVTDGFLDALLSVESGGRRVLSSFEAGSGPSFERPTAVAGLVLPGRLLVADGIQLLTVDAGDGRREVLSGTNRGGGPFVDLLGVEVSNPTSTCITVLDDGLPGVISVDRVSGFQRLLSGPGVGSGPPFARPRCMGVVRLAGACPTTALVADRPVGEPATLLLVDLASGRRSILSDLANGSGPDMVDPVAIEIDTFPELRAAVLDDALHAIFFVRLDTGDRERVIELPALEGTPTDLAFDAERERFLVTVADPPGLLAADLRSGETTVLSGESAGSGPLFGRPLSIELVRPVGGSPLDLPVAYVLDAGRGAVLAVDVLTGDRVIRTK